MLGEEQDYFSRFYELEEVFLAGERVLLTGDASRFPLKFHPRVVSVEARLLVLEMPEGWDDFFDLPTGMSVQIIKVQEEGVFYTEGAVDGKMPGESKHLRVIVPGRVGRSQRRSFFRLPLARPIWLSRILRPEAEPLEKISGTLVDISAGGAGFLVPEFLPIGTQFFIHDFMDNMPAGAFAGSVAWCRVQRPQGFRVGAMFIFENSRQQDWLARIVNQLQIKQFSRYYRTLGQGG
jgi:c-di-GMP-binding flagellar brake protein YcgR